MDTIFLIVGPSGSGKTTLVSQLEKISRLTSIQSYTDRPPRYEGEEGHIFVNDFHDWCCENGWKNASLVGWTKYNNHFYWATSKQVDKNDLYVIDPAGVKFFKEAYIGNKQVKVLYIDVSAIERYRRMRARGDSCRAAFKRIWYDCKAFAGFKKQADLVVENTDLTTAFEEIDSYIKMQKSITE